MGFFFLFLNFNKLVWEFFSEKAIKHLDAEKNNIIIAKELILEK